MPTNFRKVLANTPKDIELFVERSMDILERLQELLDEKFEGKQKLLADKLEKTEAEVSKMFSGVQNFTLKTLTKLEAAFGEQIMAVPTNSPNFEVIPVKCAPKPGCVQYKATPKGDLIEEFTDVAVAHRKVSSSQNQDLA